jgi:hypothetical protein
MVIGFGENYGVKMRKLRVRSILERVRDLKKIEI